MDQVAVQALLTPNSDSQSADTSSNHTQVIAMIIIDAMSKMVGKFMKALKNTKEFKKTSIEEIMDPFAIYTKISAATSS